MEILHLGDNPPVAPTEAILERGREHYARQEWGAAHDALASAGAALDIERRATCSYMLGREDEYLALLADAHRAHLDQGDASSAVRCGFWIGAQHAQNGDIAQAGGWLGRARRIYEQHGGEEVALGYLMLPEVFERMGSGDLAGAAAVAGEAAAIAERSGDRELFALSAHMQGHMLIAAGRAAEGLPLLDEAMLPAASGELSPIATGIVYCGVILACRDAYEVRRAREWTAVLSDWCERQPDLVAFTGRCRIHRAEILQLGGSWAEALDEAREARERRCEAATKTRQARRASGRASCTGCAANGPPPSAPTARRTATAASRSPAWRSCASRRGTWSGPRAGSQDARRDRGAGGARGAAAGRDRDPGRGG